MSRVAALLAPSLVLIGSGCDSDDEATDEDRGSTTVTESYEQGTTGQVQVLFDAPWLVEEGVWHIGPIEDWPAIEDKPPSRDAHVTGLLDTEDPRYLVVYGPALYGKYRVRIELHQEQPSIPAWCEDVVEVPIHVEDDQMGMGSFETFSDPMSVPTGQYRVRYCASMLDVAAAETAENEFEGDDYKLYSGKHLFQFWQAAPDAAQVIRQGSEFAASQIRLWAKRSSKTP